MDERERANAGKTDQIRNYLLGRVSVEAELELVEQKLLSDDRYHEELQFQEQELIDEYLNDELAQEERSDFEMQVKRSAVFSEKVRFAKELNAYANGRTEKPAVSRAGGRPSIFVGLVDWLKSPLPVAAAVMLLLLFAGGIAVWVGIGRATPVDEAMIALNRAYRTHRPLQSRISELDYAPFSNTRGGPTSEVDLNERNRAERILLDEQSREETVPTLLGLGRLYLAKGSFGEAIAQFERAERLDPNNAEIQNDLGVALLESSRANQNKGEELVTQSKALERFERAIEVDPKLAAARFNRAACLQAMSLNLKAKEAWQDYLEHDPNSPWAEEARRNVALLNAVSSERPSKDEMYERFLRTYRDGGHDAAYSIQQQDREMITGKLIPQQLAFSIAEKDPAERRALIEALRFIGRGDEQAFGDPFFAELATYYAAAPTTVLQRLSEGHAGVRSGYENSLKANFKAARDDFERAREIYGSAGDRWEALICDYWIAYADYQDQRVRDSSERLRGAATHAAGKNYHWLASQIHYWLSVNSRTLNDLSEASSHADRALETAIRSGDKYSIQKAYSWRADTRLRVKRFEEAASDLQRALELGTSETSSPRQAWRDLDAGAQLFFGMKHPRTAAAFAGEALQLNAEVIKDPLNERASSARLARVLGSLKQFDAAFEHVDRSVRAAENLKDPKGRDKGLAFAHLQRAGLEREKGDCSAALPSYERAIGMYDSMEIGQYNYEARKGRLLCRLATGDLESFNGELPEVLNLFEGNRSRILEEQSRNRFFSDEQSVYDLAIEHEIARGNLEAAFDYSERSRARSLLDLINKAGKIVDSGTGADVQFQPENSISPLALSELRPRIPDGAQLVEYAVLSRSIVAWIVSKDTFTAVSIDVSADELSGSVSALTDAIGRDQDDLFRSRASALHDLLIRPLEGHLDPAKSVFIVPDKALFKLPFAALLSADGEFVMSKYRTAVSPSANVFVHSSDTAAKKAGEQESVLSVGDPEFDTKVFQGLQRLPSAAGEAEEISLQYPRRTLLTNETATKERILSSLAAADVVHLAAHYEADTSEPMRSAFAVAGSGVLSSLSNFDLLAGGPIKAKLVVLSACETAVENYYEGEGMIGAARTLLAVGVPLVVASQWKVDSDAAAEMMKRFHRHRIENGLSSAEALRRAQLEMFRSDVALFRRPSAWAAFTALGGHADF